MSKRSRDDYKARFIIDFFMFSTLVNGICVCETTTQTNQSNELKMVTEKRLENPEHLYLVVPLRNNYTAVQSGNVSGTVVFDKMLNWIFDNDIEKGDRKRVKRSFGLGTRFVGHRKRLQFALLPIMYKMGVMTTLLTGLTVLALKGLTIGVILLFFAFGNHFLKHAKTSGHSSQPIHLHVHSLDKPGKFVKYHEYGGGHYSDPWDRTWDRGEVEEDPYHEPEVTEQYSQPSLQNSWDSYRRRFLQYTANMLRYNPFDSTKT